MFSKERSKTFRLCNQFLYLKYICFFLDMFYTSSKIYHPQSLITLQRKYSFTKSTSMETHGRPNIIIPSLLTSVVWVGLLAMTVLSLEEGLSLVVELLIESEFLTRFLVRHSLWLWLWLMLLLWWTGLRLVLLLLVVLLVLRLGDVFGDILRKAKEISPIKWMRWRRLCTFARNAKV